MGADVLTLKRFIRLVKKQRPKASMTCYFCGGRALFKELRRKTSCLTANVHLSPSVYKFTAIVDNFLSLFYMSVIVKNVRGQRAKAQAGVEASISFFFLAIWVFTIIFYVNENIFFR